MNYSAEEIIKSLAASAIYGNVGLLYEDEFKAAVQSFIAIRRDWALDFAKSVLNCYFEKIYEELPKEKVGDLFESVMSNQSVSVVSIIDVLRKHALSLLSDKYIEGKRLASETDSVSSEHTGEKNYINETKLESNFEQQRQMYAARVDKDELLENSFSFLTSKTFRRIVDFYIKNENDNQHVAVNGDGYESPAEKSYKLFLVLTELVRIKNKEIDPEVSYKSRRIDESLLRYQSIRSGDKSETKDYVSAHKNLSKAAKKLGLPNEYFLKIIDALAGIEGFRAQCHRAVGIINKDDVFAESFKGDYRTAGAAAQGDKALNAMAIRRLDIVVPKELMFRNAEIAKLLNTIGYVTTRQNVASTLKGGAT